MIFSDKIYKLTTGENVTINPKSKNVLNIFLFNKNIQKIIFSTETLIASTLENINSNYDYIQQLNENLYIVGYEKNVSVINEL